VPDLEGLAALTAGLGKVADPIVTIDEEGGDVTRLAHTTGSPYPGNAALGVVDDVELTRRVFRSIGAELSEVGVNLDFAPSVDVNSAAENPVIGTRAFGATPDLVARHAGASVTGLQEAGVAACVKHFPGHGDTREDSHLSVPVVDAGLDLLHRRELVPFRAAIAAGTQALMTAHLVVPELTGETPATLSRAAITGLLRDQLGYRGVVVTDALDMKGASGAIGIPEAAVQALIAGSDLLCLGSREYAESINAIIDAIVRAVTDGRLSAARLEEAAQRIRRLKTWLATSGTAEIDRAAGLEAARRAIRCQGNPSAVNPLVLRLQAPGNIAVGPVPWGLGPWAADELRLDPATADAGALLARAAGRGLVLVVRDAHRHAAQRELVTTLTTARPDAVILEMGLPVWKPAGVAHVSTFGAGLVNGQAAAEVLNLA
ncbi:MAG: glycoside hydrolase family 3 N-terminal domain-containing protein, partial [Streptosporangiaceae bacterium]